VIRIDGPARGELEREGLIPGSRVVLAARSPLGGPLVVHVGRTRLALATAVARHVETGPATAVGTDP
jgi:Fe2+ transport system protein FeoA